MPKTEIPTQVLSTPLRSWSLIQTSGQPDRIIGQSHDGRNIAIALPKNYDLGKPLEHLGETFILEPKEEPQEEPQS